MPIVVAKTQDAPKGQRQMAPVFNREEQAAMKEKLREPSFEAALTAVSHAVTSPAIGLDALVDKI
jgi:hypothetical protein